MLETVQTSGAYSASAAQHARERDQLILEHLPQIKYIAQRISTKLPSHVELNDLISAGVLGLLDAIEKFDPTRGVKFKTYAELRIKGAILDSLRNLDWAPRSLR
jgi:RNA polymerase sigma factor for flagellar operon FliA